MFPDQFSLRLQHGIVGGFMPAQPMAIHTLTLAKDNPQTLAISSACPPHGGQVIAAHDMRSLQMAPLRKSLSVNKEEHRALLSELHGILKTIPMESPTGCEDIYGMNITIAWGSEDLQWINSGPGGCVHSISENRPTEEDKAKFRRAVEIINALVDKASGITFM